MESQGMFGGTISLLEDVLDLRSLRHKVIASNIANIDTPHYKAFDVMMEKAIEKAAGKEKEITITRTQPEHLPIRHTQVDSIAPKLVTSTNTTVGGDGNSVDVDRAMADLSENNLMYNALAQIVSRKFLALRSAIQDKRG
jgi:flagellar basal-body rod protein FlgB